MAGKREAPQWLEGGFYDNLAAAADAVGFENLGIAWGLAHVNYKSVQEREQLLAALTRVPAAEASDPNA